jgi:hypothetical protein
VQLVEQGRFSPVAESLDGPGSCRRRATGRPAFSRTTTGRVAKLNLSAGRADRWRLGVDPVVLQPCQRVGASTGRDGKSGRGGLSRHLRGELSEVSPRGWRARNGSQPVAPRRWTVAPGKPTLRCMAAAIRR